MNGLSDVRLVLRSQELNSERFSGEALSGTRRSTPGLGLLRLFWHRWYSRGQLLELTPEQLRDIGMSRSQARSEGLKPFWRS